MKKLIICRGIQGSGKSTWARQWVNEDPEHRIRINNDDIRNMLGPYWVPKREFIVDHIRYSSIKEAMKHGMSIVVDNMNLNPKECKVLANLVRVFNSTIQDKSIAHPDWAQEEYEIELQDFRTPLEECISRDATRENPIGEKVITSTYERYKVFYEDLDYCKELVSTVRPLADSND